MKSLEDLIRYENENTALDFKMTQYVKQEYAELLKDLLSFANAHIEGPRFIILGLKHSPDGSRNLLGIPKGEFVDSATYEQLARENIEPFLPLSYSPLEVDGRTFGVIAFSDCSNGPYLMKKDYNPLRKGDSFIRKGTQKAPLTREDYERIYEARQKRRGFEGKIDIGFTGTDYSPAIALAAVCSIQLPSVKARARIKAILAKKREEERAFDAQKTPKEVYTAMQLMAQIGSGGDFMFGPRPFENRTIAELEKDLLEVGAIYKMSFLSQLYEVHAHHVNLDILNRGKEYVEDASIQLRFPKCKGLMIASKLYPKPSNDRFFALCPEPLIPRYPNVSSTSNEIVVENHIGSIKHMIPTSALAADLRVIVSADADSSSIPVACTLFGKNLPEPIHREFEIVITPAPANPPKD